MFDKVSPLFMQDLLCKIHDELWKRYENKNIAKSPLVEDYISRWRSWYEDNWQTGEGWWNFDVQYNNNNKIDLFQTLRKVPKETLFKIALDLGIEVPALVPSISETIELKIKELGKDKFQLIHEQIQEAIENCYKKPDYAISLINSALETTCKRILEKNNNYSSSKKHSTELIKEIIKHIGLTYDNDVPQEIKSITSSLLNIGKSIDDLRANHTSAQGKDTTQKIITDPNYAFFCVNAIASVILFLLSTEKPVDNSTLEDDIPF